MYTVRLQWLLLFVVERYNYVLSLPQTIKEKCFERRLFVGKSGSKRTYIIRALLNALPTLATLVGVLVI